MNINKVTDVLNQYKISKKMLLHFEKRTRTHIERVKSNAQNIAYSNRFSVFEYYFNKDDINHYNRELFLSQVSVHDNSKFYSDIYPGYVWINAKYNLGMVYPSQEIEKLAQNSCNKHYALERHHPQHHKSPDDMNFYDIMEMICDWRAMEQELGSDSFKYYKSKAVYKFSEINEKRISDCLELLREYTK